MGSTCSVINDFDDGRYVVIGIGVEVYAAVFGSIAGVIGACVVTLGAASVLAPEATAALMPACIGGAGEAGEAGVELEQLGEEVVNEMSELGPDEVSEAITEAAQGAREGSTVSGSLLVLAGAGEAFHGGMEKLIYTVADELPGEVVRNSYSSLAAMPISPKAKKLIFLNMIQAVKNKKPEDRTEEEKQTMKAFDKCSAKAFAETLKKQENNGKEGDTGNRYSENTVDLAPGEKKQWPATLSLVRTAHVITVNCIDGELKLFKGSKDVWTGPGDGSDIEYSSSSITLEVVTEEDFKS